MPKEQTEINDRGFINTEMKFIAVLLFAVVAFASAEGNYNYYGYMSILLCGFWMDITHHHYLTSKIVSENLLRNWKKGCQKFKFCKDKLNKCSKKNTCAWNGDAWRPWSSKISDLQPVLSYCAPSKEEDGVCNLWAYDAMDIQQRGGRSKFYKV